MKDNLLLLPMPQHVEWLTGAYRLTENACMTLPELNEEDSPIWATIAKELKAEAAGDGSRAAIRLRAFGEGPGGTEDGAVWLSGLRRFAEAPEGYVLAIGTEGIDLWASAPAGYLYGAMTLKQLKRQFGSELPCLRIGDAPTMAHRGMQIALAQGMTEYRKDYMEHLVQVLAGWKMNALYLYMETFFDFPSEPHLGGPGAMTADDARSLDSLCQAYHIKLIPQLNLLAHCGELLSLQKYHHLSECGSDKDFRTASPYTMCASSPEVLALSDRLLGDILDCFSADIVCVGGDEVESLGECPRCKPKLEEKGKIGIYVDHFSRIKSIVNARGRQIGIWGDMLIGHFAKSTADERRYAVDALAQGSVIYDWHYTGGSYDTLQAFAEAGFETIACASTNLCYSASVNLAQIGKHRELFADAEAAGALGGMTTAWVNAYGLHEEQMNVLIAADAGMLWSGPSKIYTELEAAAAGETFERAYALQRYGLATTAIADYFRVTGDEDGAVLRHLAPLNGVDIRKCLYQTDNVLMMWKLYSLILGGEKLERYEAGIRQARELWDRVAAEAEERRHEGEGRFLTLQEGPVLMHEHLAKRFRMTEDVYAHYDRAAKAQYADEAAFRSELGTAAERLLDHLADFAPVERYVSEVHDKLGLESSTLLRLEATKRKMRELADFLAHLAASDRPLPAFVALHDVFMRPFYTPWFIDRQHEWATGPERFRRFSVQDGAWKANAF
ncbi:family 20 glycosylhydrolase [Paenibacillus sp. MBLB4367]|uniref:family 20 glycosylhydrolase n=1 Tax=Paenibacillus sp. MBLB4367 TaxID=3384767 RepID=UPI0039082919